MFALAKALGVTGLLFAHLRNELFQAAFAFFFGENFPSRRVRASTSSPYLRSLVILVRRRARRAQLGVFAPAISCLTASFRLS